MKRLQQFMQFYFLIVAWGEEWFDYEGDLADQIEANEDMTEFVWKYGGDSQHELTFGDIVPLLRGEANENVQHWLQFIVDNYGHYSDGTSCMQAMGCGGSDVLTIGTVRKALEDIKE